MPFTRCLWLLVSVVCLSISACFINSGSRSPTTMRYSRFQDLFLNVLRKAEPVRSHFLRSSRQVLSIHPKRTLWLSSHSATSLSLCQSSSPLDFDENPYASFNTYSNVSSYSDRIYVKVPYEEKDIVKDMGAKWDQDNKCW